MTKAESLFLNKKIANEWLIQFPPIGIVKMCRDQLLIEQASAAEQSIRCEPGLKKKTKSFRENSKLRPSIETTIDRSNQYS